ncbi:hypothetical protein DVH24_018271 [Malus domestica]|uniref:Uncharacterized protein n=1 Tax=Malus domestica TaxID=3750 RepID=A0A498KDH3_MALDO|nr:hypothetical protein DVH24_018271 [Malus domestica]
MESGDYAEEESENSEKALATKLAYGLTFVEPSSEDEDLWPTYLDDSGTEFGSNCSLLCLYTFLDRDKNS